MSQAKVELGRRLFYDTRLSGNQTYSCASCHRPELAFTDGLARSVGSTGEQHPRSAMSLVNVAYNQSFNWADSKTTRLEDQVLVPMFNRDPVELGLAGNRDQVLKKLKSDAEYQAGFRAAFPNSRRPIRWLHIRKALASFVRTILSGNSAYDRYVFWDQKEALSRSAQRGMELFFSDRTRCSECHRAPLFSGSMRTAQRDEKQRPEHPEVFHNTGLYDLDGQGAYPIGGRGLLEQTGRSNDMGRFRAPTLRNVEYTAPYMHDGSVESLEEVLEFYAAGGRGAGEHNPHKSPLIGGFDLSGEEKADLIQLLLALSDPSAMDASQPATPTN